MTMRRYIERIVPAALIAIGLIIGGYVLGGRYQSVEAASNRVWVVDRFTGTPRLCGRFKDADGCVIMDYSSPQVRLPVSTPDEAAADAAAADAIAAARAASAAAGTASTGDAGYLTPDAAAPDTSRPADD